VVCENRYVVQLQPAGVRLALERAGYPPLILDPEEPGSASLKSLDLILARGRSASLLSLLAGAEGMGVRTINACSAIAAVRDKAEMSRALVAANVPGPATACGTIAGIAAIFRKSDYPLIIKPVFGDSARGIHIVPNQARLLELPWTEPFAVGQRLLNSDGFDLKLYVIGRDVFAARKPSPITGDPSARVVRVAVTPALRDLALRCGSVFGLELFGVDCIETPSGPAVIGVNDFPNYSGIPSANHCLARYAIERAQAHFEQKRA
jgi:glutathione synthase/RimK-type ligase-like ATP-grasp enzyme